MSFDRFFYEKFNAALKESRLTLDDISRKTGIDIYQLFEYKKGNRSPRTERRKYLAITFGKPENYFIPPKKYTPISTTHLEHWRW